MSDQKQKFQEIHDMLDKAEANVRYAKALLEEATGTLASSSKLSEKASELHTSETNGSGLGRIVEGYFDGQNMVGADGKNYPVPANYASKSKLVTGDKLKLTIQPDGAFLYKQIGPTDRKRVIGKLTSENGQYLVVTENKTYKVLLASVTYFKAQVGQNITLLVPTEGDTDWAAIENVVTNPDVEQAIEEIKKENEAYDIRIEK